MVLHSSVIVCFGSEQDQHLSSTKGQLGRLNIPPRPPPGPQHQAALQLSQAAAQLGVPMGSGDLRLSIDSAISLPDAAPLRLSGMHPAKARWPLKRRFIITCGAPQNNRCFCPFLEPFFSYGTIQIFVKNHHRELCRRCSSPCSSLSLIFCSLKF